MEYKLKRNHPVASYSEANQSSKVKFSIATFNKETKEFIEEYIPFRCRDYLTDILLARHTKHILPSVYGFKAKEIWKGHPYLTVTSSSEIEFEGFKRYFPFLRKLEKDVLKVSHRDYSKLYKTDKKAYVVKLNKAWIHSPVMLSFVTLILRSFASFNKHSFHQPANNIDEIFNDLASREYGESDNYIWKDIVTKKFDYIFFLSNYKDILVNPLTGIDDNKFVELYNEDFKNNFELTEIVNWNATRQHDFSGIKSLADAVNTSNPNKYVGRDWAKTYLTLISK